MAKFVEACDLPGLSVGNEMLARFCADYGARLFVDGRYQHAGYILTSAGERLVFKGTSLPLNAFGPAQIAIDKDYTSQILESAGLCVPEGVLIHAEQEIAAVRSRNPEAAQHMHTRRDAHSFAMDHGFPIFAKPNDQSQGTHVLRTTHAGELDEALTLLLNRYGAALVQKAMPGKDYRVIVLDGEVLAVIERRALSVVGDGQTRLEQLIAAHLDMATTRTGGKKIEAGDPRIEKHLQAQGYALDCVPAIGEILSLLPSANLSTGGDCLDQTDKISPFISQIACKAAATLGLRYAGIDILCPDIAAREGPYCILEVNAAPGLTYFYRANPAHQARVETIYKRLTEAMLSPGRPPTIKQ